MIFNKERIEQLKNRKVGLLRGGNPAEFEAVIRQAFPDDILNDSLHKFYEDHFCASKYHDIGEWRCFHEEDADDDITYHYASWFLKEDKREHIKGYDPKDMKLAMDVADESFDLTDKTYYLPKFKEHNGVRQYMFNHNDPVVFLGHLFDDLKRLDDMTGDFMDLGDVNEGKTVTLYEEDAQFFLSQAKERIKNRIRKYVEDYEIDSYE